MLQNQSSPSRRQLLAAGAVSAVACVLAGCRSQFSKARTTTTTTTTTTRPVSAAYATTQPGDPESIIDIHQHTTYQGRSNAALLHHQYKMGVTQTILLPGGSPVITESTLKGRANGLYAGAGTVETCIPIAREHPHVYYFGANEVPDLPEAKDRIETALKAGAVCIGEQKFNLPVDSPEMARIYAIAQEYHAPIVMHFQYETFNTGYERFGKVLAKWSRVNFIGHAQTFWANIDAKAATQPQVMYPKGKVTPGGLTDRYLSDHPNFYGDLSAGSGLGAFNRDPDHARGFIERHQDKLMFGSDCSDRAGEGPTCSGAGMISAIRRLSPGAAVARKLLFQNAQDLFKLA
jgi:predicted TIM-barrel fold metal-dependent hydrolase